MIDPVLFGEPPLTDVFVPELPAQGTGQLSTEPSPDKPITDLRQVVGAGVANQGVAAQQAGDRERAGVLESVGAALSGTDTARLIRRFTAPVHEPVQGYSLYDSLQSAKVVPTEDELDYLKGTNSPAEFTYRMQVLEDDRARNQAAGDSPLAALPAYMMDPVYFATTPLIAGAAKLRTAGRLAAGATAAGTAGVIMAAGEGAVSDQELVMNVLLNGAAGAWLYKAGKGTVKLDPDFPDQQLTEAVTKPHMRQAEPPKYVTDDLGNQVKVRDAVYEEVPEPLRQGAATNPQGVVDAVDRHITKEATGLGEKLQWNMRKTMASYGPAGKKIADLLFDNNSDLGVHSVESHKMAVRADLTALQHVYEDSMRAAMAEDGFGLLKRINPMTSAKAALNQAKIEQKVQYELFRREQLQRQGRPIEFDNVEPRIKAMADSLDKLHTKALGELKAAGVAGAEELVQTAGWHHRKWSAGKIDEMTKKFEAAGLVPEKAHQQVVNLVKLSLRRANGWDDALSYDIAAAVVNRSIRKGYFEDSLFNVAAGEGQLKQMRDILTESGLSGKRLERALDVLRQSDDDAGKAGFLKHRVDLDYTASTFVGGQQFRVVDLLDNRLSTTVDQYLDGVSSQVAFARKGLKAPSDIEKLREELLHGLRIDSREMKEAKELFDNVIAHMQGRPAGDAMNDTMRLMGTYGRMIALANSGLWQVTEYATAMGKYGLLKTTKYAIAEMPLFKQMMQTAATDKRTSTQLKDILTRHSEQNLRLRPFIHRFEDNFEFGITDGMHLSAQQAGQLVPYFNVMKYVHSHQARVVSNLILDRLSAAAKGDKAAADMLKKYGIDSPVMDRLRRNIPTKGMDVDKWDDGLWEAVRPAFAKMMDESVLHSRMGDMPAFAAFDKAGKFIFTYRSFVLTAHNKILAGGLERDGWGAVSLMLLYQFPLSMLAVQAQAGLQGKGALEMDEMAKRALGQMGGIGLFGEVAGVASGAKNQWGAPGLIPVDRGIKLASDVFSGDLSGAANTASSLVPLFAILQPTKAMQNLNKED